MCSWIRYALTLLIGIGLNLQLQINSQTVPGQKVSELPNRLRSSFIGITSPGPPPKPSTNTPRPAGISAMELSILNEKRRQCAKIHPRGDCRLRAADGVCLIHIKFIFSFIGRLTLFPCDIFIKDVRTMVCCVRARHS